MELTAEFRITLFRLFIVAGRCSTSKWLDKFYKIKCLLKYELAFCSAGSHLYKTVNPDMSKNTFIFDLKKV